MSEENNNQSRAIPDIGGGTLPNIGVTVNVYDNSGASLISRKELTGGLFQTLKLSGNILYSVDYGSIAYEYTGNGKLVGLATTKNADTPTLTEGSTYSINGVAPVSFYLVSFEYDEVNVFYKGVQIGTVTKGTNGGKGLLLNCKDTIMLDNVTITKQ